MYNPCSVCYNSLIKWRWGGVMTKAYLIWMLETKREKAAKERLKGSVGNIANFQFFTGRITVIDEMLEAIKNRWNEG
jgi:hypothetical protein